MLLNLLLLLLNSVNVLSLIATLNDKVLMLALSSLKLVNRLALTRCSWSVALDDVALIAMVVRNRIATNWTILMLTHHANEVRLLLGPPSHNISANTGWDLRHLPILL